MPRTIEDLTPGWNNTGYRLAVLLRAQAIADARIFENTAEVIASTMGFDGIAAEIARLRSPENDAHAGLTLSRLYPEMSSESDVVEEIDLTAHSAPAAV